MGTIACNNIAQIQMKEIPSPYKEDGSSGSLDTNYRHFTTVRQAIEFLSINARNQPSLEELSKAVHMSEFHLQRVFSEWAGISPKKFLQFLTKEHALQAIKNFKNIEETTEELGLSATSRLHDLMINTVGLTPGEVKSGAKGILISYGTGETPFGRAIIAWTDRGICHLMFNDSDSAALDELKKEWPNALFKHDYKESHHLLQTVFNNNSSNQKSPPLRVILKGTPFQIKVWEALIKIPPSSLCSYSQIAKDVSSAKAQRATGSAIAKNSIAYLIPCHRVIRESGDFSNYRWGLDRKKAMIAWEAAKKSGFKS